MYAQYHLKDSYTNRKLSVQLSFLWDVNQSSKDVDFTNISYRFHECLQSSCSFAFQDIFACNNNEKGNATITNVEYLTFLWIIWKHMTWTLQMPSEALNLHSPYLDLEGSSCFFQRFLVVKPITGIPAATPDFLYSGCWALEKGWTSLLKVEEKVWMTTNDYMKRWTDSKMKAWSAKESIELLEGLQVRIRERFCSLAFAPNYHNLEKSQKDWASRS